MFVNYAHRGASEYAPENTQPAFDLGLRMGANGIETDLQETKDGHLVLFHDDRIDNKSNGTGAIRDYTLDELLQLDFGSWKGEAFAGTKIMTFEEFAERYFRLDLTFAIELKVMGIAAKALEVIHRYGVAHKVFVSSFLFEALADARRVDASIRLTWLITDAINAENIAKLRSIGGTQISPRASLATPESISLAKQAGLSVRLWGVSDPELMKQVCSLDTEGMTVNFPDKLTEYLNH